MLVTSKFSFSHNVLHSYITLVRQNAVLCGNGLNLAAAAYQQSVIMFFSELLELNPFSLYMYDKLASLCEDNVDQDQTAQTVKSDLVSTVSSNGYSVLYLYFGKKYPFHITT